MKTIVSLLFVSAAITSAAVLSPTLVTGSNSIDPAGGRNDLNLSVSGAAAKASLEDFPGFAVMQGPWTGFTASVGSVPDAVGVNYLTFNDRPDVRFSFVGEPGRNSPSGTGGAAAYTSGPASPLGGESLFFGTDSRNILTIEFGAYDALTETFAAGTGVLAAGFTFARNTAAAVSTSWKVEFFDGATLLSSQSVNAGTNQSAAALFGYISQPGEQITRIVIGGSGTAYDNKNHFVDDFGFAAIPEPASALFFPLAALALIHRRRVLDGR